MWELVQVKAIASSGASRSPESLNGSIPLSHASDLEIVELLKQQGAKE